MITIAVVAVASWFVEAAPLGVAHNNGATGRLAFPEMMGGGVGLADLDGDGRLDLLVVDSGPLDAGSVVPRRDVFLRNRGTDVAGQPSFEPFGPVPSAATTYGMGLATGDVDGDGDVDVVLTALGGVQLLRNRGDGNFDDATVAAGLAGGAELWSSAAVLADLDADGALDLWVGRYVRWARDAAEPTCFAPSTRRDYCGPAAFAAAADRLWRNRGDGVFVDVTASWGLDRVELPALGGVAFDADGDGRLELYVANDGTANNLWSARTPGRDGAVLAGVAVSAQGRPQAGMGVVAADFDEDGDEDLVLTHLASETNTLYRQDGGGFFTDTTVTSGLSGPSLPNTGFGICALDANLDGHLDLLVANGAVRRKEGRLAAGQDPLAERLQLLWGDGAGRFREVPPHEAGVLFTEELVARGLACGDVDNDGDTDVLVGVNGGQPRLLLGMAAQRGGRSVTVRVLRRKAGGDALGVWVELETSARRVGSRVGTDGSYLSARDPRVVFALKPGERAERLVVRDAATGGWEEFTLTGDTKFLTVRLGEGTSREGR